MAAVDQRILEPIRQVVLPLITADRGLLFVVEATAQRVALHLGGQFSGCPGNTLVTRRLIEPVIRRVAPDATLVVTSGRLLPPGAERLL